MAPLALAAGAARSAGAPTLPDLEMLAGDLEKRFPEAMRDHRVPGVSIAVLREGRVAWSKGFGVRSARAQGPVTKNGLRVCRSILPMVIGGDHGVFRSGLLDG